MMTDREVDYVDAHTGALFFTDTFCDSTQHWAWDIVTRQWVIRGNYANLGRPTVEWLVKNPRPK